MFSHVFPTKTFKRFPAAAAMAQAMALTELPRKALQQAVPKKIVQNSTILRYPLVNIQKAIENGHL